MLIHCLLCRLNASNTPKRQIVAAGLVAMTLYPNQYASSQQTNNSSTLNNSAAPSASSVTTGGTNINYQTNNAYNNEFGFGPGIFCRTPTLYVGGNYGGNNLSSWDNVANSGNNSTNVAANAGILFPFGSSIIRDCKRLAEMIALDREISSQLSMLRTCFQLEKEGIPVDPVRFPLLKACVKEPLAVNSSSQQNPTSAVIRSTMSAPSSSGTPALPSKKPKTTRS